MNDRIDTKMIHGTTEAGKRQWTTRRKAGFAVLTAVAALLTLEIGLRLLTDAPDAQRFQQINEIVMFLGTQPSDLMLDFDSQRFWKLKPDIAINDPANTFWQGTVSNSQGYRSPEFSLAKPPGALRIVCFGDSSTFGIGSRMEDTWPHQLQLMLERANSSRVALSDQPAPRGTVEVINAGVPGYSSYQGLQHMRQEIDRLDPDIVMASYANNDFWHWDDQTDAQHAERLSGSRSIHRLLMNSRIAQLMESGLTLVRGDSSDGPADPATPNQHWAAAAAWNYGDPRPDWIRRVPLDAFRDNINAMADLCADRRVPLILVKWPDKPQAAGHWSPRMDYQAVLDEIAASRGLGIADVVSEFRANRGWAVGTYIPNDIVHVNSDGNRLAAIAARDAIRQLQEPDGLLTN